MKEQEKYKKLAEKADKIEGASIDFVLLDLKPKWMKCRRTKRLVFQFHRIGDREGTARCGYVTDEYQILPDRQENLVITQVNMLLGGLGLQVFFDLCPDCFNNLNKCRPIEE